MKKNSFRTILSAIILIVAVNLSSAQSITLSGVIVDLNDNMPIANANVTENGCSHGSTTDANGLFQLILSKKTSSIKISHVGYEPTVIVIEDSKDIDTIRMPREYIELDDVTIVGQIAVERKTPIAVSNINKSDVEEKLGNQDFPELLKSTPGIHVNKRGGDWGESEIYMRGFDNTNVEVMINGIPMNDLEDQSVYWSDLTELSDITSYIQSQRGIGANKISIPSIAGTVNIVTKSLDTKKGGFVYYAMGNDGYDKISFSVSTGLTKNKWSFTALGSYSNGDGHVQGTKYEAYSYYFNASKLIGDNNVIKFSIFGAPQYHYRRSYALTESEWQDVKKYATNEMHWSDYNPTYGFGLNGIRKTSDYNASHKPIATINHVWQINDRMNLSSCIFGAIGYGYGCVGMANSDEYTSESWFGSNDGILNNEFRCADGTFDYAKIQTINAMSDNGSQLVMTNQKNSSKMLGIMSTFSGEMCKNIDFSVGLDIRNYKASHSYEISDLYCGEYYIDPARLNVLGENNYMANDSTWVNQKLGIGDAVQRDYDSHVAQDGVFGQVEYSNDAVSTFISGAINYTTYWRVDRLYYDKEHSRSANIGFLGGNAKTGVNYNIDSHNNVFLNVGYLSRAPKFKNGAFMSANTSHAINKDARNEKMASVELGYGFKTKIFRINVNGYLTEWIDKTMTKKGKMPNKAQYFINMAGVNARHIGIELDALLSPLKWLDIAAMASLGDWRWDSDGVIGYVYDTYGNALNSEGEITTVGSSDHAWAKINTKGVHVGGSAQTTASLELLFKPFDGFKIGGNCNFYGRNFAYYTFSGSNLSLGNEVNVSEPWQIPSYYTIDIRASYQFKIGKCTATISGQVNNLLDNHYIEKAWDPTNISTAPKELDNNDVYFFYSVGRCGSVRLKINF